MGCQTRNHYRLPIAAALFASIALSGCLPLRQFRTEALNGDTGEGYSDLICDREAPNSSDDRCSFQRRTYQGPLDPETGERITGEYLFASVEFDDQGWFWDRRQMEVLLRQLYEDEEQEYLILAYAHGWQHNADACDNNVVCQQRLLERMDLSDQFLVSQFNERVKPEIPRIPAVEVMIANPSVRKMISEKRENELLSVIRNSFREGMRDFTEALRLLVEQELISTRTAYEAAPNPDELKMRLKGISVSGGGIIR